MTFHLYGYMLDMRFYPWYVARFRKSKANKLRLLFFFGQVLHGICQKLLATQAESLKVGYVFLEKNEQVEALKAY
jgi:hypothetical protein